MCVCQYLLGFFFQLVDVWSLGCIFAELLGNKPLFKGRDCNSKKTQAFFLFLIFNSAYFILVVDQLNQILYILGTPDDDTLNRIGSDRVSTFLYSKATTRY